MDILTSLFGDPVPIAVKLILLTMALVAILLAVFWVFRKFVGSPLIKTARGRQPRLAVTDAANLDDKRRLVLVRRDNVEHLVMIGGSTDILIESNIIRATSSRLTVSSAPRVAEREVEEQAVAPKSDQAVQGIVAAGAVVATSLAASKIESEKAVSEPVPDKNITTVEEIKEAAMADISLELDDMEMGYGSTDNENSSPDTTETGQEIDAAPKMVEEMDNQEVEIGIPEIEPEALSSLEDALGDELSIDEAPSVDQPPMEHAPEPAVAVEAPKDAEAGLDEKPDIEDEMQKLLDELSGEKA